MKDKINKIVATTLTQGIQPSEMADAIFDNAYQDIEIKRYNGEVIMTVSFIEHVEDEIIFNKFRYTYSLDRVLQRIEQEINGRGYRLQWDRLEDMKSTVDAIFDKAEGVEGVSEKLKVLSDFRKNLNSRLDERIKNRKRPMPEPRYDDVFFEGLEWLNRQ